MKVNKKGGLIKNKRGFTLIELLTAILILALLVTIAMPSYNAVMRRSKEKTLESRKAIIELAAEKYANDQNISSAMTISLRKLIEEGYVGADKVKKDGTIIIDNPLTGKSMLCNTVTIEIVAGLPEATMNETPDCDIYKQEVASEIVKIGGLSAEGKYVTIPYAEGKTLKWSKGNIALIVVLVEPQLSDPNYTEKHTAYEKFSDLSSSKIRIKFIGKDVVVKTTGIIFPNGPHVAFGAEATLLEELQVLQEINGNWANCKNCHEAKAASFQNQEYRVELIHEDGTVLNSHVVVRIDKEAPTATSSVKPNWENGENWDNGSNLCDAANPQNCRKKITVTFADKNGSGTSQVCVTTNATAFLAQDCKIVPAKTNKLVFDKVVGTYYVYTKDWAGNVATTPVDSILVANIDNKPPTINSLDHSTSGWTKNNMEISGMVRDLDSGVKSYVFSQSEEQPTSGWTDLKVVTNKEVEVKIQITANAANEGVKNWYLYVKDAVGRVTKSSSTITTKIDITTPTITFTNPIVYTYHTDNFGFDRFPTVDATCTDSGSGVKEFILSNSDGETKVAVNGQGRIDLKTIGNNQSISMNCSDNAGNSPTVKSQSFIVRKLTAYFEANGAGSISYSQDTCITYDRLDQLLPQPCFIAVPIISGSGNLGWGLVANAPAVIRRQGVDGRALSIRTDARILYAIKDWTVSIGNDYTNRYPPVFYDEEYNIYANKNIQYVKDYLDNTTPGLINEMERYLMYSPSGGNYYYTATDKQAIYNYIDTIR